MANTNSSDNEDLSLLADLKDIWSKATLLSNVILIATLGFAGVMTLIFEPVEPLRQVIFGTWPLVCSATVLIMMAIRGSFKSMQGFDIFWALGLALGVPYLIAYFSGIAGYADVRGETTTSWFQLFHPAHLLYFLINLVLYYFSAFGLLRFVLAIVCGEFLAWVFQIKLLPHARRLKKKALGSP